MLSPACGEKIIEHAFIAALLRVLLLRGKRDIEILRTEVDRDGYDIVLHCNGILRHVQLKSSYQEATTASVDARTALEGKPSGCFFGYCSTRERSSWDLTSGLGADPENDFRRLVTRSPATVDPTRKASRPSARG